MGISCVLAGGPHHDRTTMLHEGNRLVIEDEHGYNEYVKLPRENLLLWDRIASRPNLPASRFPPFFGDWPLR